MLADHVSEQMVKAIDLDPSKKDDVEARAKFISEGINAMPGLPFLLQITPNSFT